MARWPSHLVFALQCNKKDWSIVQAKLNSLNLPDRVMIVIMFPHGTLHFYVNKLRNLAIRATSTTHFLTLDMDMWPSRTFSLPLLPSQSLRRADGAPAGNPRLQLHGRDRSRHVPQLESRSPAVRKSAGMRHPQRGAFPRE